MKKIITTLSMLGLCGTTIFLQAAPVLNRPIQITSTLPDGSTTSFTIHPKGDERRSWAETSDGYSVMRDAKTGRWNYAKQNAKGDLESTSAIVGYDKPASLGLKKHLSPKAPVKPPSPASSSIFPTSALARAVSAPTTGTVPTLFILVSFNDRVNSTMAASFADFQTNQLGAYFREASYGRLQTIPATETHGSVNDGVVGWIQLNQNHPNFGGNLSSVTEQQLAIDAINAADPYVNYGLFDVNHDGYVDAKELAVVIIPAGYETAYGGDVCAGTPSVWGHANVGGFTNSLIVDGVRVGDYHANTGGYAMFGELHGYNSTCGIGFHQATLGIMVHELGHLIMRWPDLYDTDYSSAGLGNWSLMAGGSWSQKPGDLYEGQTPVHPDAWSKLYAGWVDPINNTVGAFTLPAAGSATATATNAVQIQTTSDPKQYFLLENRSQYGFDRGLNKIGSSTGGIAVFHVDENVVDNWAPNTDETHKKVDLEEADNDPSMDLSGDNRGKSTHLFYAGNKTTFDDTTIPGTRLYNGVATNIDLNSVSAAQQNMTGNFGLLPVVSYDLSVSTNGNGVVSSSPAGINCGTDCSESYAKDTLVTLTATPGPNSAFSGWSSDCSGTVTACTLSMNAAKTVVANFATVNINRMIVKKSGDGFGNVSSNPAGINCGNTCQTSFASNSVVTLTAIPNAGSIFTGWSGDCRGSSTSCAVNMNKVRYITAKFKKTRSYSLRVIKNGNGAGRVISNPNGIDCGLICSAIYSDKTVVTLTAFPEKGSTFRGWDNYHCSNKQSCTIKITEARKIKATFSALKKYW